LIFLLIVTLLQEDCSRNIFYIKDSLAFSGHLALLGFTQNLLPFFYISAKLFRSAIRIGAFNLASYFRWKLSF